MIVSLKHISLLSLVLLTTGNVHARAFKEVTKIKDSSIRIVRELSEERFKETVIAFKEEMDLSRSSGGRMIKGLNVTGKKLEEALIQLAAPEITIMTDLGAKAAQVIADTLHSMPSSLRTLDLKISGIKSLDQMDPILNKLRNLKSLKEFSTELSDSHLQKAFDEKVHELYPNLVKPRFFSPGSAKPATDV